MNSDLSKRLTEQFPKLFAHPMTGETIERFSFECGDGWYSLIEAIAEAIDWRETSLRQQAEWKKNRGEEAEDPPEYQAVQVKEKFGTLRFYTNYSDEYIDGAIDLAQNLSSKTCEICGQAGQMRGGSWIKSLCDQHTEELGYTKTLEKF